MAEKLGFSGEYRRAFLTSVEHATESQKAIRKFSTSFGPSLPCRKISNDEFNTIADPIHFALLALMETTGFRSDIKWIASRLRYSVKKTKAALDRLLRLGLITVQGGELHIPETSGETTHDVPSAALRKFHNANIKKAAHALRSIPIEKRDITSITLAIAPERIPLAKELIRRFRKKIAIHLQEGEKSEVYLLNIQLIPLTL
jgi:uncharacterized protein (TIGR02147 family)